MGTGEPQRGNLARFRLLSAEQKRRDDLAADATIIGVAQVEQFAAPERAPYPLLRGGQVGRRHETHDGPAVPAAPQQPGGGPRPRRGQGTPDQELSRTAAAARTIHAADSSSAPVACR